MSLISKISNSYLRRGLLAAALLTPLTYNFIAPPAIVYAQEKTAQREQESQKNPLTHRLIFGVGKSSDGSDNNATIRFLNDGFYYSVHNWTGEEVTSGFMPYNELIPTRNYLEEKNDKNPNGNFLGGFFGKIGFTQDDYMRDILRELLNRGNELPNGAIAQIEQGQSKYLELKKATKYGNAKDADPVMKFLPSGNLQQPENPPTLEGKLNEFIINSSQGTIYSRVEGDKIFYALKDGNGKTIREGDMDRNNPRDSLELKISVASINVIDNAKLRAEGEKQRYETIRNERVKSVKKWLLNISPNISNLENRINWDVVAEGLIPVVYRDNSLIGIQFKGEYARIEAGDSFAESAIGIVVNTAVDDKSKYQVGVFYQDRREIGKGAHFGVASGTFAYRSGKLKISVYGGIPVTGRQEIKSERTSTESTTSDTTGGNTVTRTTRVDRYSREYLEARKVVTFIAGYDLFSNLTIEAGAAWYSGKSGRTREMGDFKETREGVPEELKAIAGIGYELTSLSQFFNRLTKLHAQSRFGKGSPEFYGGITIHLGQTYEEMKKQKDGSIVDLLEMASIERIRVMKYTDVEERTSRKQERKVTVNPPSLNLSCSGSPNPAEINQAVTWNGSVSGGTGTYTHKWLSIDGLVGASSSTTKTYATAGAKQATYEVTSGSETKSANCGINVNTQPTLSIGNVTLTEGNSGTTNAIFNVTLSRASGLPVTVDFATANGTATSGSDYTSKSGTLTFNPGETTKTISVPVNGDANVEPDETFFVNLSNATNAAISNNQGTGTIQNDDVAPPPPPPPGG